MDKTLNFTNALGQPDDHRIWCAGILQQGGGNAKAVHMFGQTGVLFVATHYLDHGMSQIVQLLALSIGDGYCLDLNVRKDPF